MPKSNKVTLLRGVVHLLDQGLHQFSRMFNWVRPLPERALLLTDYYLFPLIIASESRPFGQLQTLNLTLSGMLWLYYPGVITFVVVAKSARNETWRGLGTGEYTLEMIAAVATTDDHRAR